MQMDDPPPRSITTAAIQVDAPKLIPITTPLTPTTVNSTVQPTPLEIRDATSQTSPPPSPISDPICITSPPPPLNWADDAMLLPISTLSPPVLDSQPPPRDLSILCSSSNRKPFSSLQCRSRRSQAHFAQPFHNWQYFTSRHRFQPPQFSSTPFWPDRVYPNHTPRFPPPSTLNWEGDPRLFELSRALNALGWV